MRRGIAFVMAGLVVASLAWVVWRWDILGVRSASPISSVALAFEPPPDYPGYRWTRDGRPVSNEELNTKAGPGHCGWQSGTFLFIGWPPGTTATSGAQGRQYIRDPRGDVGIRFREHLVRGATLPADARPTGYRYGALEIYLSPSDQDEAVYVVGPSGAERWPRSDPKTLCM